VKYALSCGCLAALVAALETAPLGEDTTTTLLMTMREFIRFGTQITDVCAVVHYFLF
jgi:hypothetical protein